jgi:hypothetical protein
MVIPTEELRQFEAKWARETKSTRTYADALAWYCQALDHVRAISPHFGRPFQNEAEVLDAIADHIRVAAAMKGIGERRP